MGKGELSRARRLNDRGMSLVVIAIGMVVVLGIAGLGVDLASLYVARSQAQRAADAAALAGAQEFVTEGCTTSAPPDISGGCMDDATVHAKTVGSQNLVAGSIPGIDISFPSTSVSDPQIQVVASHEAPTYFVKIFGISSVKIAATAKAEAYSPRGGGTPIGATCIKPWLLPNCDPTRAMGPGEGNSNCPDAIGGGYDYFITPDGNNVENPGNVSSGGAQGELISIKPGNPNGGATAAPGKFWPVFLPAGSVETANCPSCASGSSSGGPSSGSLYRQNIECCNTSVIDCPYATIQPITGNMVGPTEQGVDCLIHQSGSKNNPTGMDLFDPVAWTMTAGTNNPYNLAPGSAISTSDSVVSIPVYDGTTLCPGSSCPSSITVPILGYLQVFIRYESGDNQGDVLAYIMNITPASCGAGGGGGGGGIIATGGSSIPVRLIH